VVGAGLAGLAAALHLHDRRVATTVVEARDRVGGRVVSRRLSNGSIAELGAEWIMPGDDEVRELCRRLGLVLVASRIDYRRRKQRGASAASAADEDAALALARRRRSLLTDADAARLTVGEFLDALGSDALGSGVLGSGAVGSAALGLAASALTGYRARLQGTAGLDLYRVALRALVAEGEPEAGSTRPWRIRGGNSSLPQAMAGLLPDVRCAHRAVRVSWGGDGITVTVIGSSGRGELPASAAVVALPLPLVPRLAFDPPLPPGLAAAYRQRPMGTAAKLAVPVAGEPRLRSIQSADLPFWCWVAAEGDSRPRRNLASFAGSDRAREALDTASGDPSTWLAHLRRLNPDLVFDGPAAMVDWAADEFAAGAYSGIDNRTWDRLELFERPLGRVAFAGEHTVGPQHAGTMNGALLSGRRAAEQVAAIVEG
jgi:monoamine oxidase